MSTLLNGVSVTTDYGRRTRDGVMTSISNSVKSPCHGEALAAFPDAGIKCRVVSCVYLFIFETSFHSVFTVSVLLFLLNLPQLHN